MTEGGFFLQTQNINKILLDILDKDLDKIARKTNGTILEKSRYLVTNAGELVQELAIGEC